LLRTSLLFLTYAVILVVYALPWVVNPGAGLSPGGYDLAEWASIHPISGGETPPLFTVLLLRLPLVCATVSFTFFLSLSRNNRISGGIAVLLMSVALLPPFEFLNDTGNWNYRQQLALAIITLIGGTFGLTGWTSKYRRIVGTVLALIGAVACLMGLSRALTVMQGFNLPTHLGVGGVGTAIVFLVLIFLQWQIGRRIEMNRPIRTAQAS
jgi:hypothetical protein